MSQLTIIGKASNREVKNLIVQEQDQRKTLLQFLEENNLPIASSCMGKGQCLKCVSSQNIVTCQLTVQEYLDHYGQELAFGYL